MIKGGFNMVEVAQLTGQGGRPYNEDTIGISQENNRTCVVVADGVGSSGGGEIASRAATEAIIEQFLNNRMNNADEMAEAIHVANKEVIKKQDDKVQMKTTVVCLVIDEFENARWAHVGDSRLYRFKNGELIYQTADHSVSQMAVFMNEITTSQIRFHADRSKILRALGSDSAEPDVVDDVHLEAEKGFHAFLLCTDGFWEYVYEAEMSKLLKQAHTPEEWLNGMKLILDSRAPENNDNFSAAAVFVAS